MQLPHRKDAPISQHRLQHALQVVVAVGRVLAGLGTGHGVAHDGHLDLGALVLGHQAAGEPEPVVAALGSVGRVVGDDQDLRFFPLLKESIE